MQNNLPCSISTVISAIKKHHLHEESQFGREERKKNREMLSPFFGGEKDINSYRTNLVARGCYYREERIASYIIDVLLSQNKDGSFTHLRQFQEASEIISLITENSGSGKIMPILTHQKKMMQELFTHINGLEEIEYGVKKFIHRTNKEFRSEGFKKFWYLSNDFMMQKNINTKLFWHKVESTLAFLPTKLLQEANDDILTVFIKQQVTILSQGKKQFNYAIIKDKYNGIYDTEKGIIVVINTAPNNTDNIIIFREGGEHTLITHLNSSKYPGLYRKIKHIQDIFIHHEGFQTFYCGKVIVQGSEKEYFFDGTKIIEQFNQQEIDEFTIFSNGKVVLAKCKNEHGEQKQHMFVREINAYSRMQITHFIDPESKKTYYIDSIIEVDTSGKVYAHVLVKGGPSKKVHVIPFNDLGLTSVSTN